MRSFCRGACRSCLADNLSVSKVRLTNAHDLRHSRIGATGIWSKCDAYILQRVRAIGEYICERLVPGIPPLVVLRLGVLRRIPMSIWGLHLLSGEAVIRPWCLAYVLVTLIAKA